MSRLLQISLFAFLVLLAPLQAQQPAAYTRTEDVVYGRKFGTALTMDVIQPAQPNGFAIVWMVSGGWVSSHAAINPATYDAFLTRGYTVFAVCHGCQPKFIISEITQDIHRAIRFIRHNAATWKIDPSHIGISGGSAGGHLSLTLATQGGPGAADAKDPIDRASSAVQAAACFYPPTDFLNYGQPGEDAVGVGTLQRLKGAFGPESDTPEGRQRLGKLISPIYHLTPLTPPCLIIHGDQDKLVPLQQAQSFYKQALKIGVDAKLIVREGGGHGWPDQKNHMPVLADWFDLYLRGVTK